LQEALTSTHYAFFGLDEATFAKLADPRFIFKAAAFRTVLSQIADGFRRGKAIAIVTGEAGTGKTTLCHYLVDKLPLCHLAAVIVNPLHAAGEVLAAICDALHIDYPTPCLDENVILEPLRAFLSAADARGERTIIIMDEAQNIGYDLFQHLRGLMEFDNPKTTKLHIVFAGQPELVESLETIGFRSRSQENVIRCELAAMNKRDTIAYIRHRLTTGGAVDPIFTSAAETTVYRYTQGVPKSINMICDYSLQLTQEYSESLVTPRIVKLAVYVLSPSAAEENLLTRGITRLTDGAEMWVTGVSRKIKRVWQPLHEKFFSNPDYIQQENALQIKALSCSPSNYQVHDHTLTEIPGQRILGLNGAADARSAVNGSANLRLRRRAADYEKELDIEAGAPGSDDLDTMVIVPDVTFRSAYSAEEITVGSFLMDKTPLTNKTYARYIEATGSAPPDHWWKNKPPDKLINHPAVGVSFKEACRFAQWAGKRLPSAIEWEAAARRPGNRKFPWGDNWQYMRCNSPETALNKTVPVDFHPSGSSLDGCLDLVGNVWEWADEDSEQTDLESGYARVYGGSFCHDCTVNGAIARTMLLQMNRYLYVGFRCAKDLP